MYIITGEFKVKNECKDTLINMSLKLIPLSLEESGCISYSFWESQKSPGYFLFFERWKTRDDITKHFKKSYFIDFADSFPSMIEGKAEIEIHEIASTETV